jgi:hypothetical protein
MEKRHSTRRTTVRLSPGFESLSHTSIDGGFTPSPQEHDAISTNLEQSAVRAIQDDSTSGEGALVASCVTSPLPGGRLLRAKDIWVQFLDGQLSEWWVRKTVAPEKKIKLGHSTVMWYESDVIAWFAAQGARR